MDGIPPDWDSLKDRSMDATRTPPVVPEVRPEDSPAPVISLMAAAWADLVGILAVCTAALIAVLALGEPPALSVFPWATALALIWWAFAASVLVLVRQGTPGMLLAGVVFSEPVPAGRVAWVLAAAALGVATFGLVGLLGARSSPLRLAAGSDLTTVAEE